MEIYEFPADLFVADFIGESNFLEGRIGETDGDRMSVEIKQGLKMWIKKQTRLESGKEVTVAIRPEKIQILPDGAEVPVDIINRFSGRVNEVVYVGEASVYDINLAPGLVVGVKVQSGPLARIHKPGDKVVIGWRARHGLALNYDPIGSNSTTKGGTS